MGVADYLDNWAGLLQRYKRLVESNAFLTQLHANFEERSEGTRAGIFQYLFAIGASQLSSVARLEHVIDELGHLDSGERSEWLRLVDATVSDYGVLINGPWAMQQHRADFDAEEACACYRRMADKTKNWSITALTIQCWIARAVMLDEYLNNSKAALEVINQAIVEFGPGTLLLRASLKQRSIGGATIIPML
jgi:hypothetical protein